MALGIVPEIEDADYNEGFIQRTMEAAKHAGGILAAHAARSAAAASWK
jgi:hypothetical protein